MYIVSLYLCIWGGACVSTYVYGDFVSPNPGRPPCKLACRPSCKLTLSGYGFSYRRRRKGDRGVLAFGRAVANLYGRLVFEMDA